MNTEAVYQLSVVTYMQPCHWVRDSMKHGQRVGAQGLIQRSRTNKEKKINNHNKTKPIKVKQLLNHEC